MENSNISRNTLMLIALTNEYCQVIEQAQEMECDVFVEKMLKLLSRIYISILDTDISDDEEEYYINSSLQEDAYNNVRNNIYNLLGDKDVYLEVFEEDMKYSDTPITATVSENLSDLYQEFYNLVVMVQNSSTEDINGIILSLKDSFKNYWGQTLTNVLRVLHNIMCTDNDDFE